MAKKILFLDLDGTLLNDRKEITDGNRRAISEALAKGRRIVVTSGRPLKSSLAQARRLGLAGEGCYVIAYNGASIYDCSSGREIFRRTLEWEVLYAIFDEARRREVYVQTYDREDVVTEQEERVENARRYCSVLGLDYRVIRDVRRDISAPPVKALFIDYRQREPLESVERWLRTALAVGPCEHGGAGGLLFLQPLLPGGGASGDEQGCRRDRAVPPPGDRRGGCRRCRG